MGDARIEDILSKDYLSSKDFKEVLKFDHRGSLEAMAQRVQEEHLHHFGKCILLYTPLYISNHCVNQCVYCGYNAKNTIKRHRLTREEIEAEAQAIAKTGLKHILLLTGESEEHTPLSYLQMAVSILKQYFESISLEVYPMSKEAYKSLIDLGVDGLTLYQETYDRDQYKVLHPYGPKSDFDFRIQSIENACQAGMYNVNMGVLLGLSPYQEDVYKLGLHMDRLQKKYPATNFSVSIPRLRPYLGQTFKSYDITESDLVHIVLSLKLFLPHIGVNVSTREAASFRDNMLPLGVSKMSAGVQTTVGGHETDQAQGDAQFDIADTRSVDQVLDMLKQKGYQGLLKDWVSL